MILVFFSDTERDYCIDTAFLIQTYVGMLDKR